MKENKMKKNNILILCGTHGNEQSAIELGIYLEEKFKYHNHITVFPFVNKTGILNNSREMVLNKVGNDLNRSLGQSIKETTTSYTEAVSSLVENYDYVIDIHNSPKCANFFLVDNDNNKQKEIINILELSNQRYASRYSKQETIKAYVNNNTTNIGFTYEFSGMDQNTTSENIYMEIAKNDILRFVEFLETYIKYKTMHENIDELIELSQLKDINIIDEGFLKYSIDVNDIVRSNDLLGTLYKFSDMNLLSSNSEKQNIINNTEKNIEIIAISPCGVQKGQSIISYREIKEV